MRGPPVVCNVIEREIEREKVQMKPPMVYMNEKEFQILFHLNKGQVPGPLCQTAALQTNET